MNTIELTIIFLLLSTVSNTQQTSKISAGHEPLRGQQQSQSIYAILLEQQCAIGQAQQQLKVNIRNIFKQIMLILPQLLFMYCIYCSNLIAQYYHNRWFGLFYTILNLLKLIQMAFFYFHYCKNYEDNLIKGKIYLTTVLLVTFWKLSGIIFSKDLSQQERVSISAYFAFLTFSILFLREYCQIIFEFVWAYFHFLQSNYASEKLSRAQAENITPFRLFMFFINLLIFSLTTQRPQISLISMNQRLFFFAMFPVYMSAGFFYENPKELKKILLWLKGNLILRPLGYKLETEKCAICWQEMDIYGGVDNLEDLHCFCCHGLVRVHKNHIFHKKCILKWRLTKRTCPLDNEIIPI